MNLYLFELNLIQLQIILLYYCHTGLRFASGSSVMAVSSSSFIAFPTCLSFYGDSLVALHHSLIEQNCCREYQMARQSINHKFNRWQDSNDQCGQYRTSWRKIRLSNGKKICQYRDSSEETKVHGKVHNKITSLVKWALYWGIQWWCQIESAEDSAI